MPGVLQIASMFASDCFVSIITTISISLFAVSR